MSMVIHMITSIHTSMYIHMIMSTHMQTAHVIATIMDILIHMSIQEIMITLIADMRIPMKAIMDMHIHMMEITDIHILMMDIHIPIAMNMDMEMDIAMNMGTATITDTVMMTRMKLL